MNSEKIVSLLYIASGQIMQGDPAQATINIYKAIDIIKEIHPTGEQVDKTLSELTEEDLSANDE